MGSGKTHWGKLLAEKLQLPFFDLDKVITENEQKTITEIFSEKGEEHFRYREREVLEKVVEDHDRFILSCGGGTPCFFNNIQFMKRKGKVIWLNTEIDTLVKRLLKEKSKRPLLKNIADGELKSFILKKSSVVNYIMSRPISWLMKKACLWIHLQKLSPMHKFF